MTDNCENVGAPQALGDPGQAAQQSVVQISVVLSQGNLARLGQLQKSITDCTCAVDSIAYIDEQSSDISFSTIFEETSSTRWRKLARLHTIPVPRVVLSTLIKQIRANAIAEAAALGVILA